MAIAPPKKDPQTNRKRESSSVQDMGMLKTKEIKEKDSEAPVCPVAT
jgi:hypothetical protein